MKKIIYPAVFLEEDDGISIRFPDLEGCFSCGDTLEEAFIYAKEAMELYLEDYVDDLFANIPQPSRLKDIKLNSHECIGLIELDVRDFIQSLDQSAVKKTLTIPTWLNNVAMKQNLNFTQILQEALMKKLGL